MKAIISSTYDDKYLFFLPLVTWCWNRLGVDVICFMPDVTKQSQSDANKFFLAQNAILSFGGKESTYWFNAPEHKQATYAQCSRLYGACLDLPEDEQLIVSDIDMMNFVVPPTNETGVTIWGNDLVPKGQYPMCYISAKVKYWRDAFNLRYGAWTGLPNDQVTLETISYQGALNRLLGDIEAEHFRGNYWGKDQETAHDKIYLTQEIHLVPRAREGTQFASHRYDRDDAYILERLSLDTVDYHMNRPGYLHENFEIIMTILQYHCPAENFQWLLNYRTAYTQLL